MVNRSYIRVWPCVGHGKQVRPVVLEVEVLICEFLAIDGLSAGSLYQNLLGSKLDQNKHEWAEREFFEISQKQRYGHKRAPLSTISGNVGRAGEHQSHSNEHGYDTERGKNTYVTASEVTTLKHEAGDDSVEARSLVTETLLAGAKGAEVGGSPWGNVVEKLENNAC